MTEPTQRRRKRAVITVATVVVLALVGLVTWMLEDSGDDAGSATPSAATSTTQVPARVTRTLALIDAGAWPESAHAPGTRGGIAFRNGEGRLPRTDSRGTPISYREWDVNPKKPGHSRDAERIVTGSDGSAWYTADHYQTFARIRGPNT